MNHSNKVTTLKKKKKKQNILKVEINDSNNNIINK